MAIQIEIEGFSPNTFIDVGERRIVTRTTLIDNMVRGGFAKIVRLVPAVTPPPSATPPEDSASKAEWRTFLDDHKIEHLAGDTKARLIERWTTRELEPAT